MTGQINVAIFEYVVIIIIFNMQEAKFCACNIAKNERK